jgi:hypothetical protein
LQSAGFFGAAAGVAVFPAAVFDPPAVVAGQTPLIVSTTAFIGTSTGGLLSVGAGIAMPGMD